MNADGDNPFLTKNLPNADDAFGSSMNDNPDIDPDENEVPF
jgi:replicative DNA helicase